MDKKNPMEPIFPEAGEGRRSSCSVSKIDLLNANFSKSFRGYNRIQVDELLAEAAESLGALAEERKELKHRIALLEHSLREHKERERTLQDALLTTQKVMDDMKSTAQKEAQLILDAANSKAENMLNQAHVRLSQLHEDIAELKKQRTQFEVKLRSILDAHLRVLEMDKEEQEALDAAESKLKFIKKGA